MDTRKQELLLPEARLNKVVSAALALVAESGDIRRWIGARRLRHLCGLVMSPSQAVPMARFHLRRLYDAFGKVGPCTNQARMSEAARMDLA